MKKPRKSQPEQEEAKPERKFSVFEIVSRENIAIVLSLAAFVVSLLSYQASVEEPKLFVSGTVESSQGNGNLTATYYSRIEVYNLGQKVATNVNLSVWHIADIKAIVDISPKKPITMDVRSSTLFVSIPEIEAGKSVVVFIWDAQQPGSLSQATPGTQYGPPYFVHASSQEGSSKTTIIGLDNPSIGTPAIIITPSP